MFYAMKKMGNSTTFIVWVELLFENASVGINLNGILSEEFKIEKGVIQGCPLAPYLFNIVGKALTHIIKRNSGCRKI